MLMGPSGGIGDDGSTGQRGGGGRRSVLVADCESVFRS